MRRRLQLSMMAILATDGEFGRRAVRQSVVARSRI